MDISELYSLFLEHPVVTTDTRDCPKGSIFFALKGASFNGNEFARQALENGSSYAVIDEMAEGVTADDARLILVDDVLTTLQQLANHHRKALGTKIIGVTGTNGKTTTKELIAAVLSEKYNVLYTLGNFNNHIGVPKTLLRLTKEHEIAVIEMGANHPGEIKTLVDIVEPDCGIITNVGRAHLGGFGSFEGVIKTKGELYDFLRPKHATVFIHCENNQPKDFMEMLGDYDKERIKLLVTQDVDGDEVEAGMEILRDLYKIAKEDKREDVPVSKLRIGLKCGGSDGFSGITANPLVGELSDWLVAQGGTSILTEVPEMFGAETILMNRCETKELFEDTVKLVNDFKEYFLSHGEPVGENPSPGNKKGGISTLEDKALGCTQKCGRAPVSGVLGYGDRLQVNGLNLLSAPGNDLVASTALASAGCHIVLFTTGRGTPFGTFVPTMKVATNPTLASRKSNWIDFNAGQLIEGKDMLTVRNEFIDKVLAVASGEPARNEINGYREISIFKNGVTL